MRRNLPRLRPRLQRVCSGALLDDLVLRELETAELEESEPVNHSKVEIREEKFAASQQTFVRCPESFALIFSKTSGKNKNKRSGPPVAPLARCRCKYLYA